MYTQTYFRNKLNELPYVVQKKSYVFNEGEIVLDKDKISQWAKAYKNFVWFAQHIFKTYRTKAAFTVNENEILFTYPNGESRICLTRFHKDVLVPVIEKLKS